jgi:hypothetical protein
MSDGELSRLEVLRDLDQVDAANIGGSRTAARNAH